MTRRRRYAALAILAWSCLVFTISFVFVGLPKLVTLSTESQLGILALNLLVELSLAIAGVEFSLLATLTMPEKVDGGDKK